MLASILYGLAHVVNIVLNLAVAIIIIAVGVSWFQIDRYNQFVSAILQMNEVLCKPFRPLTRRIPGPFDFAPFFAMLVIVFFQKAVPTYLMALSHKLQ